MTENQNEIIARLVAEFEKMNNVTTNGGGKLFNKSVFDENKNLANKMRAEIELSNKAIEKEIDEMIKRDIATLDEELFTMGLYAVRKDNNITITSLDEFEYGHKSMTRFSYRTSIDNYVRLSDGTLTKKVNGFNGITMYLHSNNSETKFESLVELASDKTFQKNVQELYYNVNN